MPKTISDWMSNPVVIYDLETTVSTAYSLLCDENAYHLVVVVDPGRFNFGILTASELSGELHPNSHSEAPTRVREIVEVCHLSAHPSWSLHDCAQKMKENNVQALPVLDENNLLVGVISITDLYIAAEEIGWDEGSKF